MKLISVLCFLIFKSCLLEEVLGMALEEKASSSSSSTSSYPKTVKSYYPIGYFGNDATTVTWAHAVNSLSFLEASLRSPSLKMLEADILMGTLKTDKTSQASVQVPEEPEAESSQQSKSNRIPILAHPPDKESDLSLETFLDKVFRHNQNLPLEQRKGIKLDFKEPEAAAKAIPLLRERLLQFEENPLNLTFPIWINGDILPGPVDAPYIPDSLGAIKQLIQSQKQVIPQATLSLGWTTRYPNDGSNEDDYAYTKEQFQAMAKFLKEVKPSAPVTFPVRARFILNSVEDLLELLDTSGIESMIPSVTLWEGSEDPLVTKEELKAFVDQVGKGRVFVDLPRSSLN